MRGKGDGMRMDKDRFLRGLGGFTFLPAVWVGLLGGLAVVMRLTRGEGNGWAGVLYFLVMFAYAASYGTWRDGEQKRRWEPYVTVALGIAVWVAFAGLWLFKPFAP